MSFFLMKYSYFYNFISFAIKNREYLKTHVKGDAGRIICHLQITSSNYRTSWNRSLQQQKTANNTTNQQQFSRYLN